MFDCEKDCCLDALNDSGECDSRKHAKATCVIVDTAQIALARAACVVVAAIFYLQRYHHQFGCLAPLSSLSFRLYRALPMWHPLEFVIPITFHSDCYPEAYTLEGMETTLHTQGYCHYCRHGDFSWHCNQGVAATILVLLLLPPISSQPSLRGSILRRR
jgi:hypothetical protein